MWSPAKHIKGVSDKFCNVMLFPNAYQDEALENIEDAIGRPHSHLYGEPETRCEIREM